VYSMSAIYHYVNAVKVRIVSSRSPNEGTRKCRRSLLPNEARFRDIRRQCPPVDKLIRREMRVDGSWISDEATGPRRVAHTMLIREKRLA